MVICSGSDVDAVQRSLGLVCDFYGLNETETAILSSFSQVRCSLSVEKLACWSPRGVT